MEEVAVSLQAALSNSVREGVKTDGEINDT